MVKKILSSPWILTASAIVLVGAPWLRQPTHSSVDVVISPDSEDRAKMNTKKIHVAQITGKAAIFTFDGTVLDSGVHKVKTKFRSSSRSTVYTNGPFPVDSHGQFSGTVQVGSESQAVSDDDDYTFDLIAVDNEDHQQNLMAGRIAAHVSEVAGQPQWYVLPVQLLASFLQLVYVWFRLTASRKPAA